MNLIVYPIILPLIAAGLCLLVRTRLLPQQIIAGASLVASLAISALLLSRAVGGEVMVLRVAGWPQTFGIVLAVDILSALMLVLSGVLAIATFWFSVGGAMDETMQYRFFHPAFLILVAGVNWAFVTGDLFNLFVSFELILLASYVLLVLTGRTGSFREGSKFVVLNVLAGTLFLIAAGLVYGVWGTLNYADLALKIQHSSNVPLAVSIGTLLLVVFAIKAGLFPLFFWLPDAYPKAPGGVLPYFSGILTKVGVYCLFRFYTLIFRIELEEWFQPLLLALGALTMVIGVLGALSQNTFRHILSFHIISQVGYMIFGLGLFSEAGFTGGIFHIMHNAIVKSSLLMISVCVILGEGTDTLKSLGGMIRRRPWLTGLFFFAAFSLAGLPPLSGFYGKYFVVVEGISQQYYLYVAAALVTSLFTMTCMVKIWNYSFLGERSGSGPDLPVPRGAMLSTSAVVFLAFVIIFISGPLVEICAGAAAQLANPETYITAVLDVPELPEELRIPPLPEARP